MSKEDTVNRKPNPTTVVTFIVALVLVIGSVITTNPKNTSATPAPTGTEMTNDTVADDTATDPEAPATEEATDPSTDETTTNEVPDLGTPEGEDPAPALTCPNGSIEVDHSETWQEPEFCVIVADGKVTAWTADGHLDPDTYIKNVNTDETSPDLGPNRVSVSIACEQTVVLNDPNIQDGAVNILWKHTAPACPPPAQRIAQPTLNPSNTADCIAWSADATSDTEGATFVYNPAKSGTWNEGETFKEITITATWANGATATATTTATKPDSTVCNPPTKPVTPSHDFSCTSVTASDNATITATTDLFPGAIFVFSMTEYADGTYGMPLYVDGHTVMSFEFDNGTTSVQSQMLDCVADATTEKIPAML